MISKDFNYNKWIRTFEKVENDCIDALVKGKILLGIRNQIYLYKQLQKMLKEMRDSVPNSQ
jgi:hypothetical protein